MSSRHGAMSQISHSSDAISIFVPGRVCLFGEHSDWAGVYRRFDSSIVPGLAIVCGTSEGLYSKASRLVGTLRLTSTLNDGSKKEVEFPMNPDVLLSEAQKGGFWSYACGVAYEISTNYQVGGLYFDNYKTDLPLGKGLSSSAAFCVSLARAFNRIYDLKLSIVGEMYIAYQGEINTPSRCGRLDQCCAYGNTCVEIAFDGDSISTREVSASNVIHMVLVDLKGKKDTTEILRCLSEGYPFPKSDISLGVRKLLGEINQGIVQRAIGHLENSENSPKDIGHLMKEAQDMFDKYAMPACPHQLEAPLLHKILNYPSIQPLIYGGKGVGSQGDGTAQLVARSAEDQEQVISILEKECGVSCMKLSIGKARSVKKAIIPCAGFCPNLFPACQVVKSPLFPILDKKDGIMKPAVLILVEQALEAGIEKIGIVIQEHDKGEFENLFFKRIPYDNYSQLPRRLQLYSDTILTYGTHITLVTQPQQMGLGNAVLCCKSFVGQDAFVVLLGDHLYQNLSPKEVDQTNHNCISQLIETYIRHGVTTIGLHLVQDQTVTEVGVASGKRIEGSSDSGSSGSIFELSRLEEKPSLEFAKQHLQVEHIPLDTYLGFFGIYVLTPEIFESLEMMHSHNMRETTGTKSIGLTGALDILRRGHRIIGKTIDGVRFDIGTPEHYIRTVSEMA